MKKISSLQNPLFKQIAGLRNAPARRESQSFLVEGAREIERALQAGYRMLECLVCPELLSPLASKVLARLQQDHGASMEKRFIELDAKCFNALVMRKNSDGIVLVLAARSHRPEDYADAAAQGTCVLALEELEKPGNIGAVLRSADAAGVSAVYLLSNKPVDVYHPNIIRASLGTVFSLPIIVCSNDDYYQQCRREQRTIYAACLSATAKSFWACDFRQSVSIVLGSEAWGLSAFWQAHADAHIIIPMHGIADSLNVSVASAVIMYEVQRQRSAPLK